MNVQWHMAHKRCHLENCICKIDHFKIATSLSVFVYKKRNLFSHYIQHVLKRIRSHQFQTTEEMTFLCFRVRREELHSVRPVVPEVRGRVDRLHHLQPGQRSPPPGVDSEKAWPFYATEN